MPFHGIERRIATRRIRHGGFPYHLALLQLEHDASFRMHSPFASMREFLEIVMRGFAEGAPKHHHLVFKAHPLEDGRAPLAQEIARLSAELGVASRVHFLRGGKLAELLNQARSAVTVNSTAGQQVLWRGIPLKVFGQAVFAKPEFAKWVMDRIPLGRLGQLDEVAAAVVFVASDAASLMTGTSLVIDGGWTAL